MMFKDAFSAANHAIRIHGSVDDAIRKVKGFINSGFFRRNLTLEEQMAHLQKLEELKSRRKS